LVGIFVGIVVALVTVVANVYFPNWLRGCAELQVTLYQPIPNLQNDGKIQFMVIESKGSKPAKRITTRVEYPRSIQPLDYRIKTLASIVEETRTDSYLKFTITQLPRNDFVLVVFAVNIGEIEPKHMSIAHEERAINVEEISYVRITHFKEYSHEKAIITLGNYFILFTFDFL